VRAVSRVCEQGVCGLCEGCVKVVKLCVWVVGRLCVCEDVVCDRERRERDREMCVCVMVCVRVCVIESRE
jgi:hypothetical protein